MKKVYFLKSCDTCRKIMSQLELTDWQLREIKAEPISERELAEMYSKTKSYEALFSKKSMQLKRNNIDWRTLREDDFKNLILQHYSYLKRPVFLTDSEIFIGSDRSNLKLLGEYFGG